MVGSDDSQSRLIKHGLDVLTPVCPRSRLLEVRGRLYELLTHCIPPDVIMKVSLTECISHQSWESLFQVASIDCPYLIL